MDTPYPPAECRFMACKTPREFLQQLRVTVAELKAELEAKNAPR